MSSHGIRDRVGIVGMGCTPFAEHWDCSLDDLIIDAVLEALQSAGITADDVDACWFGTLGSGRSGLTLAKPLKLDHKPVTRVENFCATGSEAFRNACYAVASGAYDVALAVGAEKLKDSGYSGLAGATPPDDGTSSSLTAPAMFSLLVPAYAHKYRLSTAQMREVLTHIAWKNHYNGARNPLAQFQREVSKEKITNAPVIAGELRVFDCSGVSDGAAAAVIVRAQDTARYRPDPLYVKALSLITGRGSGGMDPTYDYTSFPEVVAAARDAYQQAGVTSPRHEISMAEVHDCFTPTELILMEDLGFTDAGGGWKEVLAGAFDLGGDLPVNPDGGLKSFGHPIGASGLRMIFECWLQLRQQAPADRQISLEHGPLGLTHNLGGQPGECVSFVGLFGSELTDGSRVR